MGIVNILLIILPVSSLLTYGASGYRGMMVGGRIDVRDVKSNKAVQELGRFCVKEFNKQLNTGGGQLIFSEVVAAQTQVVSGIKYYLQIEASNQNGETKVFDSVVLIKAWLHEKELIAFEPAAKEFRKD